MEIMQNLCRARMYVGYLLLLGTFIDIWWGPHGWLRWILATLGLLTATAVLPWNKTRERHHATRL